MRTSLLALAPLALAATAGAQTTIRQWFGPSSQAGFGGALASVGDIDSDGVRELMIGAPSYYPVGPQVVGEPNHRGLVSVYSSASGKTLLRFVGQLKDPNAGHAVAAAGDLERDGIPDLLYSGVGSCCYPSSVRARSGATGEMLLHLPGTLPFQKDLGHALVGGIDVDLDGVDDLLYTTVIGATLFATRVRPARRSTP